jgi:hypothetical protein
VASALEVADRRERPPWVACCRYCPADRTAASGANAASDEQRRRMGHHRRQPSVAGAAFPHSHGKEGFARARPQPAFYVSYKLAVLTRTDQERMIGMLPKKLCRGRRRCRKPFSIHPSRPAPSCFPEAECGNLNYLVLILFASRARTRERLRQGSLRQPARPTTRHPQSQATGARSRGPAIERTGALGSDRPQASSVAGARRATIAAAARADRPGGD